MNYHIKLNNQRWICYRNGLYFVLGTNGVYINGRAHVTQADISATNGIVHIIDHVLIPSRYLFSAILGKK